MSTSYAEMAEQENSGAVFLIASDDVYAFGRISSLS
jgi:hypothetical protein